MGASAMKRVCQVLQWHRGGSQWKLSLRTASFLSSYVLVILFITVSSFGYNWWLHDGWWVAGLAITGICYAFMAAAASLGYIRVSSRAARSSQLHLHGLVLLVMQTAVLLVAVSEALLSQGRCAAGLATLTLPASLWSFQKAALFMLVRQKLMALEPHSVGCMRAHDWGSALVVAALLLAVSIALLYACGSLLVLRHGLFCFQAFLAMSGDTAAATLSVGEEAALLLLFAIANVGAVGVVIAGGGTIYTASTLRRRAVSKLVERQVRGEELAKVQRGLRHHELGMFISITSTQLFIAALLFDRMDVLGGGQAALETFILAVVASMDNIGDIVGILLLSGVGALLLREDHTAGDVTSHIRGLLHSAVLTGRAEMLFEGHVGSARRKSLCIASFPGKFCGDWHTLTWACEQGELSSACVFLPQADTQQRFGKHALRAETPGKCWCHTLYGEKKSWGCLWWQFWQRNVELAVELELELVVVFFPGEAGKGIVQWKDLGTADLWDGVGLGGSQKCELAYILMRGFRVIEEDLEAFRARIHRINTPDKGFGL